MYYLYPLTKAFVAADNYVLIRQVLRVIHDQKRDLKAAGGSFPFYQNVRFFQGVIWRGCL
jgi:hypothetical protein